MLYLNTIRLAFTDRANARRAAMQLLMHVKEIVVYASSLDHVTRAWLAQQGYLVGEGHSRWNISGV